MIRPIKLPESCSFSDYFKLNAYPEEILANFGYGFELTEMTLPQAESLPFAIEPLQLRLKKTMHLIRADNEMARREFLIAPLLTEVVLATNSQLRVSYPVEVSSQLRGSIDYFLQARDRLLVIEAKDENLERGFKQLAVELIAIAQENQESLVLKPQLWGAVSIGKIWQFALLDFEKKIIYQDLNLYSIFTELEHLLKGLIGILNS